MNRELIDFNTGSKRIIIWRAVRQYIGASQYILYEGVKEFVEYNQILQVWQNDHIAGV